MPSPSNETGQVVVTAELPGQPSGPGSRVDMLTACLTSRGLPAVEAGQDMFHVAPRVSIVGNAELVAKATRALHELGFPEFDVSVAPVSGATTPQFGGPSGHEGSPPEDFAIDD
jgi:hypothetical protein